MRRRKSSAPAPPAPTEQVHPRSEDLELRSTAEILRRLNAEDEAARRAVKRAGASLAKAAELIAQTLRGGGRLIYVGAGTSGRLAALDAAECPPTFGISPRRILAILAGGRSALSRAIEGAEDDRRAAARQLRRLRLDRRDLVCGVSASARTPFVRAALRYARSRKVRTVLVCCSAQHGGLTAVDVIISLETGPELIAGSTRMKAGTATKMALNALSTAAMIRLGKVYRGRMIDARPTNRKLRDRAERIVSELGHVTARDARKLLLRAQGRARVAIAMALTGLNPEQARAEEETRGLRALEATRRTRSGR